MMRAIVIPAALSGALASAAMAAAMPAAAQALQRPASEIGGGAPRWSDVVKVEVVTPKCRHYDTGEEDTIIVSCPRSAYPRPFCAVGRDEGRALFDAIAQVRAAAQRPSIYYPHFAIVLTLRDGREVIATLPIRRPEGFGEGGVPVTVDSVAGTLPAGAWESARGLAHRTSCVPAE
jgi:hypothetical protein